MWTCPFCDRTFKNENQWHSCGFFSLEDHFTLKPDAIRDLFFALIKKIKRIGDFEIDPVKTMILAKNHGGHFLAFSSTKSYINLNFASIHSFLDERIVHTEQIGRNLYSHKMKIYNMDDLDEDVLSWIKDAYFLSNKEKN